MTTSKSSPRRHGVTEKGKRKWGYRWAWNLGSIQQKAIDVFYGGGHGGYGEHGNNAGSGSHQAIETFMFLGIR
jgi:hypothetical protein